MTNLRKYSIATAALLFVFAYLPAVATAQNQPSVLAGAELTRVVPPGFYFQGQSAPTQMRNAAAVRFGTDRYVIAGLVDTSGYSADVRAKYEGFIIADTDINIGGESLGKGAYGFGFSDDGKLNIMDLAGDNILSVAATKDSKLRRPRPLMMSRDGDGVRLYSRRDYALISPK
jgi:hypothetical protein